MSLLENAAALAVLVNIALAARRSVWNYPFALLGVALYAVVFWQARLYATAVLQVAFLAFNLYGWRHWLRARDASGTVEPRALPPAARLAVLVGSIVAAVALSAALARLTDSASPVLDAVNTAASLAAQALLALRYTDNWPVWVGVNLVSLWLYGGQGLWTTTALYAVLLALAGWGWWSWARAGSKAAA